MRTANPPTAISAISRITGTEMTWTAHVFHLSIRDLCDCRVSYVRGTRFPPSIRCVGAGVRRQLCTRILHAVTLLLHTNRFCTHMQEPQEGQIRKVRPDALITIQRVHMGHRCHAPPIHTTCDGPLRSTELATKLGSENGSQDVPTPLGPNA